MWRFLPGVSKISASKKIPLLITVRQQRSVNLANTKDKDTEIFIEVAIDRLSL